MASIRKARRLKKKSIFSTKTKSGISRKLILAVLAGLLLPQYAAPSACSADNLYGTSTTGEDEITYYSATVGEGDSYEDVYGSYYVSGNTTNTGTGSNSSVSVSGGTISGSVYGGYAYGGAAEGNTVEISSGTVSKNVFGGYAYSGSASSNGVTVSGGSVSGSVFGGYAYSGSASSNGVTVSSGSVGGSVYGSYAYGGAAEGNTVEISGGTVSGNVMGSYVQSGSESATENTVEISGGTITGSMIVGGYLAYGSGDASENTVTLDGSDAETTLTLSADTVYVWGGATVSDSSYSGDYGSAKSNTVTVSDVTFGSDSYASISGGVSYYGSADSNSVTITNTKYATYVSGGWTYSTADDSTTVQGNSVTIGAVNEDGTAADDTSEIYGAFGGYTSGASTVSGNTLTINGGTISGFAAGGYVNYQQGTVTGNSATVNGGTVYSVFGGFGASLTENSLTVNGGTVYSAHGAYSNADTTISKNTLTITGGTVGEAYGGESYYGEDAENAVSGNTVTIEGGTVGEVYGACSQYADVSNNSVTISGGTIGGTFYDVLDMDGDDETDDEFAVYAGNVYGGYVVEGDGDAGSEDNGNSVTITGGTIGGSVYGGYTAGSGSSVYNSVDVTDGKISGSVYGGYSYSGESSNNRISISGGAVSNAVYGGYAESGAVSSNTVSVAGGSVGGNVYGGYTAGSGAASSNSVSVASASVSGKVYGGYSYSGSTSGNSVSVSSSDNGSTTISSSIYGGYSASGEVSSNSVSVSASDTSSPTISGSVYGGYTAGSGTVSSNSVKISGGSVGVYVMGGYSASGSASSNSVDISGGSVGSYVMGGYSSSGSSTSNTVKISGGTLSSYVMGGYSVSGSASSNSIDISGGTFSSKVYGGYINSSSSSGEATSNSVYISGGTLSNYVYGGYTNGSGEVSENSVNISGGTFDNGSGTVVITGGYSSGSSNVSSNRVTMSDGALYGYIYGGYAASSGEVSENTVTISGGSVSGYIYGGLNSKGSGAVTENTVAMTGGSAKSLVGGYSASGSGDVTSNSVSITGGTISSSVYGGYSSGSGAVTSNSVSVTGGTTSGSVVGGRNTGSGDASENRVTVSGGTLGGSVFGGYTYASGSTGSATANTVTISGGTVKGNIYGGEAYSGAAGANIVTITGGTVTGNVTGGYSYSGSAGYTDADTGEDYGNIVTITGGSVGGDVYGGNTSSGPAEGNSVSIGGENAVAVGGNVYGGYSVSGSVSSNSVKLSGNAEITGTVYGGYSESCEVGDNSLTVAGTENTASDLSNFSTMTFDVSEREAGDTMLTLTSEDAISLDSAVITVDGLTWESEEEDGSTSTNSLELDPGEKITLIDTTSSSLSDFYLGESENTAAYSYGSYDYTLSGTEDAYYLTGSYSLDLTTETDEDEAVTAIVLEGGTEIGVADVALGGSASEDATETTLSLTWGGDALITLTEGLTYDFSDASLYTADSIEISGVENTLLATSDSYQLIDGSSATVTGLEALTVQTEGSDADASASYSYEPASGVTVTGTATYTGTDTDSESSTAGGLALSVSSIDTITFGTITYSDEALITLDMGKTYDLSKTTIDVESLTVVDSEGSPVSVTYEDSKITEGGTVYMTLIDASEDTDLSANEETSLSFGYTLTDGENSLTGTMDGVVTVTDYDLVLAAESSVAVSTISLDTSSLQWGSDALLTLNYSLAYEFSSDSTLSLSDAITISGVEGTLLASSDSMTLLDANGATVTGLASLVSDASASYCYEPASGVTVEGTALYVGTDTDDSTAGSLTLSVSGIDAITFGTITYSDEALITLDTEKTYDLSETSIDISDLTVVDSEGSPVSVTYDDPEITDGGTVYMTLIDASEDTGLSANEETSLSFGYTLTNEENSLTGTMAGVVTVNDYDLVLAAESKVTVSELTLDTSSLEWGADALLTLNDSLSYDFSDSSLDISDSVAITGVSGTLLAASDSMTLLEAGSATVTGLASLTASSDDSEASTYSATYSYEPASGVTVSGTAAYSASDEAGISIGVSSIDAITFGEITYSDSALITLDTDKTYDLSSTSIDVESLTVVDSEGSSVSVAYDDSEITDGGTVYMTLIDASEDTGLSANEETSLSFGYTLTSGENSLTGTMDGVVTVNDYDLVLAADSSVAVSEISLDTSSLEWGADALLTLNDSLAYDFTSASVSGLDETSITTSSFLDVDASTTLIDTASATVSGLSALESSGYSYSYSLLDGVVTVTGSGSLTVSSGNVDYTISSIDTMDFYITSDTESGSTILTVATADLSGTAVTAYAEGGSYLTEGYEVTLLTAEDGLTTDDSTTYTGTITEGVSVEYDLDVYQDGDSIVAVVAGDTEDDDSDSDSDTGSDEDDGEASGSDTDTDTGSDEDDGEDSGSDTDTDTGSDEDDGEDSDADTDTDTDSSEDDGEESDADTDTDTGSDEDDGEDSSSSSGSSLRSETKSLVETRLAQLAMLEQGADLLAGSFSDGTLLEESLSGWTPFAAMNRTSYKYSTGSYVDIDGFNAAVGVLKTDETDSGRFTYGVAFQYGSGEYDSHADGVKARGDTEYTGGALLARHQWHSGAYADLILSRGNTEGDYKSSEILDGVNCSYKDDAPYWGASLTAGRELALRGDATLDVYGRYLYSHIASSSVKLSTGETYDFDSTDSSRLRLGTRYTRDLGANCRYYAGLAYEYQFDGAARATYNGMSTLSPSLEGSSGMLEAGVRFAPDGGNLTVDLGATGWTGTRKGVEGRLTLNFSF